MPAKRKPKKGKGSSGPAPGSEEVPADGAARPDDFLMTTYSITSLQLESKFNTLQTSLDLVTAKNRYFVDLINKINSETERRTLSLQEITLATYHSVLMSDEKWEDPWPMTQNKLLGPLAPELISNISKNPVALSNLAILQAVKALEIMDKAPSKFRTVLKDNDAKIRKLSGRLNAENGKRMELEDTLWRKIVAIYFLRATEKEATKLGSESDSESKEIRDLRGILKDAIQGQRTLEKDVKSLSKDLETFQDQMQDQDEMFKRMHCSLKSVESSMGSLVMHKPG